MAKRPSLKSGLSPLFLLLVFPTIVSTIITLEQAEQLSIDLQSCDATITSTDVSVGCTFLTPSNLTTHAQLLDIPCNQFNYPANGGDISPFGTFSNIISTSLTDESITLYEKNNLTQAIRSYCARVDLFTLLTTDPDAVEESILAKKINVTVQYNFTNQASFSVDNIQMETYELETTGASALRTMELRAYQCNLEGNPEEYAVNIGSILHLCIENANPETQADAIISDLEYLGFQGEEGVVIEPIKDGTTDFITEFDCTENGGMKCHVKTLMVPSTFDMFGGQPMKAFGIVGVQFLDNALGRRMRKEELASVGKDKNGHATSDDNKDGEQNERKMELLSRAQDRVSFAVVFELGPSLTAAEVQAELDNAVKSAGNVGVKGMMQYCGISLTFGVALFANWITRTVG